jgi:hypothetical protein
MAALPPPSRLKNVMAWAGRRGEPASWGRLDPDGRASGIVSSM